MGSRTESRCRCGIMADPCPPIPANARMWQNGRQIAACRYQGSETTEGVRAAIRDTPTDTKEALRDLKADEANAASTNRGRSLCVLLQFRPFYRKNWSLS